MKIVYCLNSIRYLGGIQRVTIVKANTLAEMDGNTVYIVVTDNKNGKLIHPLSPKVHLIDLDINYYKDDWKSKWNVLKGIFLKRREHKRRLQQVLRKIQPDVVVSAGQSEKNMLPSIPGNWIKIRELHFVTDYRMRHAHTLFQKLLAVGGNWIDYHYYIKRYDCVVLLTQEDKETNWKYRKANPRVEVIPNPISFSTEEQSTLETKRIITVGRLSAQKNYQSLVQAYRKVAERHPDWVLEIYGEGEEKAQLQHLIERLRLTGNVHLQGYTSQVKEEMLGSSCFVLSSIYEGLPLVLIEAMECGLPIVSYACPCGPKDIIADGKDGFLVPVKNEAVLADRLCQVIEDETLRKRMGAAAKERAKDYDIAVIAARWMKLFRELSTLK